MINKVCRMCKEDNRGSSVVTVLVVTVFISILATTLLYVSATNVKVKQVDYQNKTSFYEVETPLEEMKALFIEDASVAFEKAYKAVMVQYASASSGQRDELYKKTYVQTLKNLWEARRIDASTTDMEVLSSYFGLSPASALTIMSVGSWDYNESAGYAQFRDVQIGYTNAQGYTTILKTDFYLEAPSMDWSIDSSGAWYSGAASDRKVVKTEDFVVFKNWQKCS